LSLNIEIYMKLLSEQELVGSSVVANNLMNRQRNASGVNSYEQEIKFKPELYLEERILTDGCVSWLDVCCGEGKALIQAAIYLANHELQDRAELTGVDLVDVFAEIPPHIQCLRFEVGSVVQHIPEGNYDLITCVHGLHYIGDKLKVLREFLLRLKPKGVLLANLDLKNIKINGKSSNQRLIRIWKQAHIHWNSRSK
jgi:ubiquinone/menaquinone biosynthesis C-methylase UbiE